MNTTKNESGIVMVLMAMFLVVIFSFIALSIDLNKLAEQRQRGEYTSRLLALSLLEEWFRLNNLTGEPPTLTEREEALEARAQAVFEVEYPLSESKHPNFRFSTSLADKPTSNEALIIPGVWHHQAPSEGQGPCVTYPCFERLTFETAQSTGMNAIRIEGEIFGKSEYIFAKAAFGAKDVAINVNTTSSIIPRRGCFLVDVSPTIIRENHKRRTCTDERNTPQNGHGSEYSMFIQEDNPDSSPDVPGNAAWSSLKGEACGALPALPSPRLRANLGGNNPLVHYLDDYSRISLLNDSDYNSLPEDIKALHPNPTVTSPWGLSYSTGTSGADRRVYRVNTYRNASVNQSGPEPLTSIMSGLKAAMDEFSRRRVEGDMACLIFFDDKIDWARVVLPTSNFDYIKKFIDYSIDQNFLGTLPDDPVGFSGVVGRVTGNSTSGLERGIRHGIFPMAESGTNIQIAILEALNRLAEVRAASPQTPSSDFITLVTDGLTNCCTKPAQKFTGYQQELGNPDTLCGPDATTTMCNNTSINYLYSMYQLDNFVQSSMNPDTVGIPLHVMLLGKASLPHTYNLAKTDPVTGQLRCMEEREARTEFLPWVGNQCSFCFNWADVKNYDSSTWHIGGQNPYGGFGAAWARQSYEPVVGHENLSEVNSRMYNLARYTRGMWMPLRPTKNPLNNAACVIQNPNSCTSLTPQPLYTDPECRSTTDQAVGYLKQVVNDNPYVIVDSGYR